MKKILALNFLTLASLAQENINKSDEISQLVGQNAYEPNFFGMILGLFFVVGLIYITGFLYQKLTKTNAFSQNFPANKAQIISTTSIGQGRNLHVIKIGNEAILIGSTQNSITYIKDVKLSEIEKCEENKNGKSC